MDGAQRGSRRSRSLGRRCTWASDWPTHAPASWSMPGWWSGWTATRGARRSCGSWPLAQAFAALSELARWSVRATGRFPTRLGEWLAGIGALIVLVEPASGGWLVLGIGVWTMGMVRRKAASGAQQPAQASGGGR
jgi:hypothetical protein